MPFPWRQETKESFLENTRILAFRNGHEAFDYEIHYLQLIFGVLLQFGRGGQENEIGPHGSIKGGKQGHGHGRSNA